MSESAMTHLPQSEYLLGMDGEFCDICRLPYKESLQVPCSTLCAQVKIRHMLKYHGRIDSSVRDCLIDLGQFL